MLCTVAGAGPLAACSIGGCGSADGDGKEGSDGSDGSDGICGVWGVPMFMAGNCGGGAGSMLGMLNGGNGGSVLLETMNPQLMAGSSYSSLATLMHCAFNLPGEPGYISFPTAMYSS